MDGFKTMEEGEDVEFDMVDTDRGLQARHIVKL